MSQRDRRCCSKVLIVKDLRNERALRSPTRRRPCRHRNAAAVYRSNGDAESPIDALSCNEKTMSATTSSRATAPIMELSCRCCSRCPRCPHNACIGPLPAHRIFKRRHACCEGSKRAANGPQNIFQEFFAACQETAREKVDSETKTVDWRDHADGCTYSMRINTTPSLSMRCTTS